ncbi:uncharacterized protein [Dermacentor andersoni]|uniref:uncharacterized protein isoform X2 n=1 Tax=Dermacentor andersoni TaxID=34620 RepID=UPI0024171A1D|nr:mucin-2-like isoform X2 [Dermacentor andersoni]
MLLGGVSFPPSGYHTLSALRQAADTCKSSSACPCPKNKFVSTRHPDSPSWSSAAVASAMPANLRNPSSLLRTLKERLKKAHAKAKPPPAFPRSIKQIQTKHEARPTKEGYATSLSSTYARLVAAPAPATSEENGAATTEASVGRRTSSTNSPDSPEESFPQTTAVRRELHFQRGLPKTGRSAHAMARMFPREEAVKEQVNTTTNHVVFDGNEHKAPTASDDTDVKWVASVLILRSAGGGGDGGVFSGVGDFATRSRRRFRELGDAANARVTVPDVAVSRVGGSTLTESSETFAGRNTQSSAIDTEVSSTHAATAEAGLAASRTSSHAQLPISFYVTSVTAKGQIFEAMDAFPAARTRSRTSNVELKDISETDEMSNIVAQVVLASPGNVSVELSSEETASENGNIMKLAETSTTTPYANNLDDSTLKASSERHSFELTTHTSGASTTRKLARKCNGCFFVPYDGRGASSSENTLHEIMNSAKSLTQTNNRTYQAFGDIDKSTTKATMTALSAIPNTTGFETEPVKEMNLGSTATKDILTETKFPSAVTYWSTASYVEYEQILDGEVTDGQSTRLLARHPRAAESFSTITTSTTNSSPSQTDPGTNTMSIPTKLRSEQPVANRNGHLLTHALVESSEGQTKNGQPIVGSTTMMLLVETERFTSTNRPQTAEATQPSTLLGSAVSTGTRFNYESRTPLITKQTTEVRDVTLSPKVVTRGTEVHKEMSTDPSQLMTSGGDKVRQFFKTNSDSEVSTLQATRTPWSTSWHHTTEEQDSDTTQVTSPVDLHPSGTSADRGLTLEETTTLMPLLTVLITMQPSSLPLTSEDVAFTDREIRGVISTHAESLHPTMTTTKDALLTVELTPPTQDAAIERTTLYTTLHLASQQTAAATLGEREAVTVDVGRSSSPSQSSTSQAGGPPNSGIDPKGTGKRQPEVTPHATEPPEAYPSVNGVRVRLGLDADYGACVRGREWQFREHIRRQLSVLLRVPLPGVRNVRVLPGSIIVEADMVPVKTPSLDVDKSALLAARTDLQDRIDRGTAVVTDLEGNRLPVFTSTVYSLQPPRGTSYSPALLGALTVMFFGAASVIVASAYLVKRHVGERHVSPSPEVQADTEQQRPPVDERPFLRLVSPGLLISTRLDDPATASILRDARMLPRRSLVPDPPVYRPARGETDSAPVTSLPPPSEAPVDPPESVATWQSHPFDSSATPSDAFSLATWSSTPFQPMSRADFHTADSEATSRWTATPRGRMTSSLESQVSQVPTSVAISEQATTNGQIR